MSQLAIIDIRDQLPRANWNIGWREKTTSLALHYNGGTVPVERQWGEGLMRQLEIDCAWQMRAGWSGTQYGADGLQYHYVVSADGKVYQTRDADAVLWHCGVWKGNNEGVAIHLPLGGEQDATPAQWAATVRLFDQLRAYYKIPANQVLGHQEWMATSCPGFNLMGRLITYRKAPPPVVPLRKPGTFTLRYTATVRTRPGLDGKIVMTLQPGHEVEIDVWKNGDKVGKDRQWGHWKTGWGFIHSSAFGVQ